MIPKNLQAPSLPGPFAFPMFAPVEKVKGYRWPGVVVARFHTLDGAERYVIECTEPAISGALHIYGADNLRRREL
jgi:hypothetical protein